MPVILEQVVGFKLFAAARADGDQAPPTGRVCCCLPVRLELTVAFKLYTAAIADGDQVPPTVRLCCCLPVILEQAIAFKLLVAARAGVASLDYRCWFPGLLMSLNNLCFFFFYCHLQNMCYAVHQAPIRQVACKRPYLSRVWV